METSKCVYEYKQADKEVQRKHVQKLRLIGQFVRDYFKKKD